MKTVLPILFISVAVQAADWPTFRGADRTDVSSEVGLLKKWPSDGPKKVWMNEDSGLGYSGYAIVGNVIYTMGARDAVEYVIAIDAATGKEKWSAEADALLTNARFAELALYDLERAMADQDHRRRTRALRELEGGLRFIRLEAAELGSAERQIDWETGWQM